MPETENKIGYFVSNNWRWILVSIIAFATWWSDGVQVKNDVSTNKRRTQNYINETKNLRQTIHDLELRIVKLESEQKMR